jgi:hypothetical protein
MKTLEIKSLGIKLNFDENDKGCAAITSDMKDKDAPSNSLFNAAVDGLESLILAHFCAGIDVASTVYIEGLETAYNAIGQNMDEAEEYDDSKITIKKTRRVSASVDEVVHYNVDRIDWDKALEKYNNEGMALRKLQSELKVNRIFSSAKVDDVHEEFESLVSEV